MNLEEAELVLKINRRRTSFASRAAPIAACKIPARSQRSGCWTVSTTLESQRLVQTTAVPPPSTCDMACCMQCLGAGPDKLLTFSNSPSSAVGDASIQRARRCHFAIFFPEDVPAKPVHMFFDREKDTIKVLEAAVAHAGLKLDRGRLVGSPEKLNLFTIDGDMLRTDLPLDAHLGSTIHPSSVLLLEKGNRVLEDRLDAVKLAVSQQSGGMGCSIL